MSEPRWLTPVLTCDRMCPEVDECLVTSPLELEAPFSAKLDSTGRNSSADCRSNGTATDVAKEDPMTANYRWFTYIREITHTQFPSRRT